MKEIRLKIKIIRFQKVDEDKIKFTYDHDIIITFFLKCELYRAYKIYEKYNCLNLGKKTL